MHGLSVEERVSPFKEPKEIKAKKTLTYTQMEEALCIAQDRCEYLERHLDHIKGRALDCEPYKEWLKWEMDNNIRRMRIVKKWAKKF